MVLLTVALATADGALSNLIFATAIGFCVYALSRRRLNRMPQQILEIQKQALEGADNSKEMAVELEKVTQGQRWANKEMAVLSGIAAFAYPPLGVVALAAVTAPAWVPVLSDVLGTDQPVAQPRQGFFEAAGTFKI